VAKITNNITTIAMVALASLSCVYLQYLQWENEILDKEVDYDLCQIDPAPFQLVERTSLLKVKNYHLTKCRLLSFILIALSDVVCQ
jgi:hypothetical protein